MRTIIALALLLLISSCSNQKKEKATAKSVDYVFTCNLIDSPGVKEKYKHYHSADGLWPEVNQAAKESGANSLKIYIQDSRLLLIISLPKGLTFEEFNKRYNESSPKMADWDKIMSGYQTAPPGAAKNQTWVPMKEIYGYGN